MRVMTVCDKLVITLYYHEFIFRISSAPPVVSGGENDARSASCVYKWRTICSKRRDPSSRQQLFPDVKQKGQARACPAVPWSFWVAWGEMVPPC